MIDLIHGDCLEVLAGLESDRFHSCVTDPPYELGFMGKAWDGTGIAYNVDLWREVLRVLKPGAHLIAFGGSRTYHRLAVAVEDAGFEIRDQGLWLYGSGFPKSLDVSKAIDKAAGAEREREPNPKAKQQTAAIGTQTFGDYNAVDTIAPTPATPDAIKWDGWGTALKPAHEPICIARKPFSGTVAANVLEHGTGAINVDGCRVGDAWTNRSAGQGAGYEAHNKPGRKYGKGLGGIVSEAHHAGRFPANLIHDGSHAAIKLLGPESRYFYCAKASRAEREAGCEGLPARTGAEACDRDEGTAGLDNPRAVAGRSTGKIRNHHPCVKPLSLMRYLVRLVTPPGGTVLDHFAGSGTCGVAAVMEGFGYVGIELDAEYYRIAKARIEAARHQPQLCFERGKRRKEGRLI